MLKKLGFILLTILSSLILFIILYNLFCLLSPPKVIDTNGEVHLTMPIGQVMLAGILSFIAGTVALFLLIKRFRSKH